MSCIDKIVANQKVQVSTFYVRDNQEGDKHDSTQRPINFTRNAQSGIPNAVECYARLKPSVRDLHIY